MYILNVSWRSVEDSGSLRPEYNRAKLLILAVKTTRLGGGPAVGYVGHKKAFHVSEIVDAGWARFFLDYSRLRGGLFARGQLCVTPIAKTPLARNTLRSRVIPCTASPGDDDRSPPVCAPMVASTVFL